MLPNILAWAIEPKASYLAKTKSSSLSLPTVNISICQLVFLFPKFHIVSCFRFKVSVNLSLYLLFRRGSQRLLRESRYYMFVVLQRISRLLRESRYCVSLCSITSPDNSRKSLFFFQKK
jgi:hypothetical protein